MLYLERIKPTSGRESLWSCGRRTHWVPPGRIDLEHLAKDIITKLYPAFAFVSLTGPNRLRYKARMHLERVCSYLLLKKIRWKVSSIKLLSVRETPSSISHKPLLRSGEKCQQWKWFPSRRQNNISSGKTKVGLQKLHRLFNSEFKLKEWSSMSYHWNFVWRTSIIFLSAMSCKSEFVNYGTT